MAEPTQTNPTNVDQPWTQNFMEMFGFGDTKAQAAVDTGAEQPKNMFQQVWDMFIPKRYADLPQTGPNPQTGEFDQIFNNLIKAESNNQHMDANGKLITSSMGAKGITQIMPKTGKNPGYGVAPLKDNSEAEYLRVGKELLRAYIDNFQGDSEKGVAAYNYGPGNVGKLVEQYGSKWKSYLPKETKDYLKKVIRNAS